MKKTRRNAKRSQPVIAGNPDIVSYKDAEVLWGGGIVPRQDEVKYVFVVGTDVVYKRGTQTKEGFEIRAILASLQSVKRNGQYALFEDANIGDKPQIVLAPRPYTGYPVAYSTHDGGGKLLEIVSSIEEADRILGARAQELVDRHFFTGVSESVPFRRIESAEWASDYF